MDRVYDVIVVGGGIAGVSAAVAASRLGAGVLLIEKGMSFGGVLTGSLVNPMMTFHSHRRRVIGGIGQEIVERLVRERGSHGHLEDPIGFVKSITPFDPEKMKSVLIELIREARVDYLFNSLVGRVWVEKGFLQRVETVNANELRTFIGRAFIDATGEGNLSIKAGARYVNGDGNRANCQPMTLVMRIGGINRDEIISFIGENESDFVLGEKRDFSYLAVAGFFSLMPLLRNYRVNFRRDRLLFFEIPFHPGEVFMNTTRYAGFGGSAVELTAAQSDGNIDVWKFMDFLKSEVPGFANASLIQTGCSIGVRETTHVTGEYMMKVDDLLGQKEFVDKIAIGSYPVDLHVPESGELKTMKIPFPGEYSVPLRALFPLGLENVVLAGRALSAEHLAFSALRTSPLASATGMAAGICAALSKGSHYRVREVPIKTIQKEIARMGGIL